MLIELLFLLPWLPHGPAFFAEIGLRAAQVAGHLVHQAPPVILLARRFLMLRLILWLIDEIALFRSRLTLLHIAHRLLIRIIATHLAPLVADARHLEHHLLGVALRHLEVADGVEQVDVAHLLPSAHEPVEQLHQHAGVEPVAAAQVDKQAAEALLRLVLQLLAVGLLLPVLLVGHGLLYLRGIGVVGEELAELQRHDFLDELLLVDVFEVAVDVLHEGGYLLVVDVGLDNLVHHLVQLLLADLLCRGYLRLHELLAYLLLDAAYLVLLATVDDGDRGTLLAGTACTAGAVGIVLDVVGQPEVDHVRQVVHVEATGSHVRCHEQLRQMLAELLHRQVALGLREVAVQRLGIVAVADELVGHLLRLHLGAAEDDGEDAGVVVHDALQGEVLVLGVHHIIDVVHVLGPFVARAHHDLLVVVQVVLGDTLHLTAHRGREHQGVMLCWQGLEDLVDAFGEAHVQHLVGFVKHDVRDILQMHKATVHQVYQSAWRGHDDVHPLLQGAHLRLYGSTAIDGLHVYAFHVFGEVADVIGNLQAQFAGGGEYQGLRVAAGGVDTHQQGDAEGGGLARTCLSQGYHVLLIVNQIGDYSLLHRHWLYKS